jgi:hypothetical protein
MKPSKCGRLRGQPRFSPSASPPVRTRSGPSEGGNHLRRNGNRLGFWVLWGGLVVFSRQGPPERSCRRIELCQGRAQRAETLGGGELVFLDGAPDGGRHRGVLGVGEIDRRHGPTPLTPNGVSSRNQAFAALFRLALLAFAQPATSRRFALAHEFSRYESRSNSRGGVVERKAAGSASLDP